MPEVQTDDVNYWRRRALRAEGFIQRIVDIAPGWHRRERHALETIVDEWREPR